MSEYELTVRIVTTLLIVFAAGVAVVTASSALAKWKVSRQARDKALADRAVSLRLSKLEDEERAAAIAGPNASAQLRKPQTDHSDRRRSFGLLVPTGADVMADLAVGSLPSAESVEAPTEVWWGLAALIAATLAGLLDTWA